jgi:hypothetical protein
MGVQPHLNRSRMIQELSRSLLPPEENGSIRTVYFHTISTINLATARGSFNGNKILSVAKSI